MAGNDTLRFYYPWPAYGVKMSRQWPNVRENFDNLAPLVRAAYVDLQPSSAHNAGENDLAGWAIGERDFRNKFRIYYDKEADRFSIQYNSGTEDVEIWNDYLSIRQVDGRVTVHGYGGLDSSTGGFYTPLARNLAVSGTFTPASAEWIWEHALNTKPILWNTFNLEDKSIVPQSVDVSDPNVAYFYFSEAYAGRAIAVAEAARGGGIRITDGTNNFIQSTILSFSNNDFYLSHGLEGYPTVNLISGGGATDHGTLAGLSDDDHSQYLLASQATDRATFTTNWTDLTDNGATTLHTHAVDHGALTGLSDDDHTQYLLRAETPPGFYGVYIRESDGNPPTYKNDTLIFDSSYFYLNSTSIGKPMVSLRNFNDDFIQSGAGAVVRTSLAKERDTLTIADYGATGVTAEDGGAAYALELATAPLGRENRLAIGQYRFDETKSVVGPANIVGEGCGAGPGAVLNTHCSQIYANFASGDLLYFGPSLYGTRLENFQINSGVGQRTAGAGIKISATGLSSTGTNYRLNNLAFNNQYDDIVLEQLHIGTIENTYHQAWKNAAIVATNDGVHEGAGGAWTKNYFFGDTVASTTQSYIIDTRNGYTRISDNLLLGAQVACRIIANTGSPVGAFEVINNWIEENDIIGIQVLNTGGTAMSMLRINNNEFSVATQSGAVRTNFQSHIAINAGSAGAWLTDVQINDNIMRTTASGGSGNSFINANSGTSMQICRNVLEGLDANNTVKGIVVGSEATQVDVLDNIITGTFNAKYSLTTECNFRDFGSNLTVAELPTCRNGSTAWCANAVPGSNPVVAGGSGAAVIRDSGVWKAQVRIDDVGPGFYGIFVRESDGNPPTYRNDTIIFDSDGFYVNSNSVGKPIISLRGAAPGGSDTQIQFNNSGSLAGTPSLTIGSNDFTVGPDGSAVRLIVGARSDGGGILQILGNGANADWQIDSSNGDMRFLANDSEKVRFASAGHVTISSGNLSMSTTKRIVDVSDPIDAQDVVTKAYLTANTGLFYGVIFQETDGNPPNFRNDTVYFNSESFYLTSDSIGKPIVNFRGGDRGITFDDGVSEYRSSTALGFAKEHFYLSRGTGGKPVLNLRDDFNTYKGHMPGVVSDNIFVEPDADHNFEVVSATLDCKNGSAIVGFYLVNSSDLGARRGARIEGMDPITVSSVRLTVIPSSTTTMSEGDRLVLSIIDTTSCQHLVYKVKLRKVT